MTDLMRELEADFQPTNEELLEMTLKATADALDAARDRNAELVEENERLTAQRNMLLGALTATLPELRELENYWKNEAEAFDNPFEDAERRLSLSNLEDTRRVIKRVRAAIKEATA